MSNKIVWKYPKNHISSLLSITKHFFGLDKSVLSKCKFCAMFYLVEFDDKKNSLSVHHGLLNKKKRCLLFALNHPEAAIPSIPWVYPEYIPSVPRVYPNYKEPQGTKHLQITTKQIWLADGKLKKSQSKSGTLVWSWKLYNRVEDITLNSRAHCVSVRSHRG